VLYQSTEIFIILSLSILSIVKVIKKAMPKQYLSVMNARRLAK